MSKKARLTFTQQGLYFESINDPSGIVYNNAFLAKLSDKTDIERFIGALKTTVKAHPSFSVRFGAESDGTLFQEYDGQNCVPVDVFRMSNEEFAGVRKGIVRPFDLNGGCLFRFEIYITPGGNYFFMDSHHTVFDGVSYYVLQNELQTVYNGGTVECEKLDGLDAALYEEELLAGEYRTEAKNYYEELLGARDADCLPLRDAYGETQEKSKLSIYFDVDSEAFKALREKTGVSATGFFTTVMGHVVARYSNRTDSVIATLFNGRNETNKDVFAMMVRTIPFVTDLSAETKIEELLKKQQSQLKTNRKYCVYPFSELAADHGVNSDILFTYQGRLMDFTVMNDPDVKGELLEHESAGKIAFLLNETDNGSYKLEAMFRSDLYSEDFIRGMAKAFIKASGEYLKREYIGEIEMADEEAVGLINAFNATEADYPERKTVVELFREQAKKTPENLCLVSGENKYTYSQIDEITDRFARVLAGKGIGREKVAGILIPRNEYMLICALSVLKAGGAYMPLDPTYPPERLKLMLEDSGAVLLITTPELDSAVTADYDIAKIMADDIYAMEGSDDGLPCPEVNDLAVLLYTSGSTGVPKGVMWEHGNITVLIEWVKKYYKMGENSNVAGYASFGFDANIYESYPAVTSGAALYVIPDELRLELASLRDYFNSVGMTHAVLTTQVGRQLALIGGFDTLKHLTVAGEKLTPLDPPKDINLYNVYGPTEGSCATSAFKMDKYYSDVPIGKPLDNLKAYVVDANGRLLPAGAVGELWISGPHVTRGYLNRPEKTAEAYGDNPFSTQPGYERIYRTGDVVRYLAGGDLQFVGRRDAQVKIRGFRIELTEVEEVVRRCPKVKDATVAAFDDPSGGKFIAAYVVSDEEVTYDEAAEFIRAEKPPYMVPAVIMQIDKIPLNQNQKVNKKALPVPERKFENTVPPQNETQQAIFDILAEVLGHSAFGINTDIYEAGLSSVGTVRLNVMLADRFEVPVKISDLRANPTVEKLEAFFAGAEKADEYSVQEDYPITRTQNGIFVESTANADSTVYNIPVLFRLADGIDPERLTEAVRTAINAHPYLKTTLCLKDGDIRARRNDSAEPAVEYIKCEKLPEPSALLRPFRLLDSALYRAGVYDTSDGLYLFADIHHIISDGVSERILFDDISKAYAGGVPVKESYTGFEAALDEQKARESERFGAAAAYYEKLLKGRETECMPAKAPSDDSSGAGTFTFESDLDPAAVSDFCDSAELTANAFFNAVFGFVLSRFTFREDAVFTTIYNGRSDSRLVRSTAMMVKTIPVAADAEDEKTVREYTAAIQNQLMNSMANDIYSFEEISGAYGVRADVMFIYQGDSFELDTLCGKPAEVITVASDTAKAPVSINVYIKNGKYHLVAEYRREIYCEELVRSLTESVCEAAKRSAKRAPKKSLEQKLCDMFASVLGAEEYYADDDFFEMGGTSLSASKITMLLMSEGIEVEYGDIFSNPTPAALAEHIEAILRPEPAAVKAESTSFGGEFEDVLRFNTTEYTADLKRESIGDVLLTGAVGYLGIHVLRELIDLNEGHIYCLIRRGRHGDPVERLKMLLMYYFDDTFDSVIENNITVIDADITDGNLGNILKDIHFDTLINCAACVKHFASDDILERVNVTGVENLIGLCKSANARMVHISTTSIPGIHTPETYEKRIKMHENELFVIDAMFNKYVDSKYRAEKKLLEAVRDGLRGRIIRVGNLMGRYSDGEFQINFNTNMFFSGIRGFAAMGMYPISHMTDPMSFSPIDCTARAIVLLAGADDKFTAFNADNRYGFDEMKIIDACCRNGISIAATEDREYYEEYHRKLGDERFNKWLNGLAAYDRPDLHAVETDNLFTANVLYRMGFSWPLTDDAYLDRVVKALKTLGYFDI